MVSCEFPLENAWRAIHIWATKPSAYNKSVAACELLCLDAHQSPDPLEVLKEFFRTPKRLQECSSCVSTTNELSSIFRERNLKFKVESLKPQEDQDLRGLWVAVRLPVHKKGGFNVQTIDFVLWDFEGGTVHFLSLNEDRDRFALAPLYTISYNRNVVRFNSVSDTPRVDKIRELFVSKINQWTRNPSYSSGTVSLGLVDQEKYYNLYNTLKKKYTPAIKNIWEESTDPDKFIHEDVAIATYLILIWGEKPLTFVDVGCGNGLLVHILNGEGHRGWGVDVRARKIWKSYPSSTVLKEETVVPSLSCTFPGVEWIIGNHSDELTPWIPVISLLSSESTNFFLLPCCAYEFSGVKFRRTNAAKSQYMDYLDYVERICDECGFVFSRDRLKIPSTKRICFVSRGRTVLPVPNVDRVQKLINGGIRDFTVDSDLMDVKTREAVEKVRNCTQLDRNFVSSLVMKIVSLLLNGLITENNSWNAGQPLAISTIASMLSKDDLLQLKSECGGLQTFLRNHRFIFRIADGKVSLRKPEVSAERTKSWKTKPCWFFSNHPQSCPLDSESCSFLHSETSSY